MWWRKTATARPAELPARSALAMALEPRMLFDGAVAATVAETATVVPSADAAHAPASGQILDVSDDEVGLKCFFERGEAFLESPPSGPRIDIAET